MRKAAAKKTVSLQRELRSRGTKGAYRLFVDKQRNFIWLHDKSEEEFAKIREEMDRYAEVQWRDLFRNRIKEPLHIVLLTREDGPAMLDEGVGGFFRPSTNTLICGDYYFTWPKCFGDTNNHKFEGIEPYVKFKPDSDPSIQFNQPSVYVALNKQPDKLGGQAYQQHFTITVGDRAEEIDTTIGKEPLLNLPQFQGLNAWSRGMAYYHRPSFPDGSSNWHEHPNFFNPFWRAKLAPIAEKVNDLASGLGLSGEFADMFTRELITH